MLSELRRAGGFALQEASFGHRLLQGAATLSSCLQALTRSWVLFCFCGASSPCKLLPGIWLKRQGEGQRGVAKKGKSLMCLCVSAPLGSAARGDCPIFPSSIRKSAQNAFKDKVCLAGEACRCLALAKQPSFLVQTELWAKLGTRAVELLLDVG